MIKKLADEDCRVVDLLLDREHPSTEANAKAKLAPEQSTPHRAVSLEKVLSLLHAMPVADPPSDLKFKTLSKIDAALARLRPMPDHISDRPVA